MIREHVLTEIVTFEYIMWRKSYISGEMRALIDEGADSTVSSGSGKLVDIVSGSRLMLNDDYTDLHGGVDCFTKRVTLEEVKKMVNGEEGTFLHDEKSIPPTHQFKLKEPYPINIQPPGSPLNGYDKA